MNVLITGGAGFIGSHLARYCKAQGHNVHIIDKDFSKHKMEDFYHKYTIDLSNPGTDLKMIFGSFKPDVCFHLAAYASEGRSNHIREYITRNNTLSTMAIINMCVQHHVKLVFTSSVAVFSSNGKDGFNDFSTPHPIDEYGLSKYMSELSMDIADKTQGLIYTIVRPRNVYGPGQNMWDPSRNLFGIWMYNALHGKECLIYGNGNQIRQFTYIDDLIPCLYRAWGGPDNTYDLHRFAINLGALRAYTVNEAMEAFKEVTGYKNFRHIEARHEVQVAFCATGLAEHKLGWNIEKETRLTSGLRQMAKWAQLQAERPLDQMPPLETDVNAHSSLLP